MKIRNLKKEPMKTEAEEKALTDIWMTLRFTYGIIPIAAGLDKFTDLLTKWDNYLSPVVAGIIPFEVHTFMMAVGVIEMIIGIIVLTRPRIGGYVVMTWFLCIILNLLTSGDYLDIAIRDLAMAIGAFSLAKLSTIITHS